MTSGGMAGRSAREALVVLVSLGLLAVWRSGALSAIAEPATLAPRIREVKARVDELTARKDALATASTPVVRIADDATLARYVERLQSVLATGSAAAQRAFLRAWVARIEADGMKLTVTFTLPGALASAPQGALREEAARTGTFSGAQNFLPPVANGDPKGN